jgi:hypothetical protein
MAVMAKIEPFVNHSFIRFLSPFFFSYSYYSQTPAMMTGKHTASDILP